MMRREAFFMALMFALVSLWSSAFQPQNDLNGYDGKFYFSMAQQMTQGQPVTGPLPWVYRVGTPFLASVFAPVTGDLMSSFKLVNIVASALTTVLLALYLRRHINSLPARLIVMFLFLTQWHAPVRFAYFYPTSVDFWLMVFVLAALLVSDVIREKVSVGARHALPVQSNNHEVRSQGGAPLQPYDDVARAQYIAPLQNPYVWIGLLSIVVFVGVLFREVIVVFGVAALFINNPVIFAHNPAYIRHIKPKFALFLPLAAAICAIFAMRAIVNVNQEGYPYTFDGTVYLWLYDKRLMSYLLAWFVAFGPVLMLVLYNWRRAAAWLSQRQDVVVFVLALVVLAWVGGTDTERFLYWGMPVFYVLLGRAVEDHTAWLRKSPEVVLVLVVTQMLSQRFLLPTPDFNMIVEPQLFAMLTVLGADSSFEHLHTFYSTLRWQSVSFQLTVQYLVLAAALLLWISRRAGKAAVSD